eukprot:8935556-Pyramimonas_sp.AAC.1
MEATERTPYSCYSNRLRHGEWRGTPWSCAPRATRSTLSARLTRGETATWCSKSRGIYAAACLLLLVLLLLLLTMSFS